VLDRFDSFRWLVVAVLLIPVIAGSIILLDRQTEDETPGLVLENPEGPPDDIRVYIAGAVNQPGVYALEPGDRWIDALEAAGGAAEDANLEAINLSRRVRDEDQILVPRAGTSAGTQASGSMPLVNINTATVDDLDTLPGIGEVRATRIVDSRTREGPFGAVEDLLARDVIPESVFEEISALITVN
jgi:competence protein ComEA